MAKHEKLTKQVIIEYRRHAIVMYASAARTLAPLLLTSKRSKFYWFHCPTCPKLFVVICFDFSLCCYAITHWPQILKPF